LSQSTSELALAFQKRGEYAKGVGGLQRSQREGFYIALRAELTAASRREDNANRAVESLSYQLQNASNQQQRSQLEEKLNGAQTELAMLRKQNKQIQLEIKQRQEQRNDGDPVLEAATDQIVEHGSQRTRRCPGSGKGFWRWRHSRQEPSGQLATDGCAP
jgi:hypothetical protein